MSFHNKSKRVNEKKRKKQLDLAKKLEIRKRKKDHLDDEIESQTEDEDEDCHDDDVVSSEEEQIEETGREKRLRLAKKYLQEIENEEREKLQDEQFDGDIVTSRLREEVLAKSGKLIRKVAQDYSGADLDKIKCIKNLHKSVITCMIVSTDGKFIYSVSKDSSIVKTCLSSGQKLIVKPGRRKDQINEQNKGHFKSINCIAISSDSRLLATGCESSFICLWNPHDLSFIHQFKGHKSSVNGLVFRRSSHTLYSCSTDRSVKVWNCDDFCYVETLFGHQDKVVSIDCGLREKPITSGGGDETIRIWKIVEQSQLVFQGHSGSIDCVKYLDEEHFISGGDDGTLSIWGSFRKKPLYSQSTAHGEDGNIANWVCSLASLINTDLFASGSKDGCIKVWKCAANYKKFEPIFAIPVVGFVNSLQFSPNGDYLIAAIGREHRFGRWWCIREATNSILTIPLIKK